MCDSLILSRQAVPGPRGPGVAVFQRTCKVGAHSKEVLIHGHKIQHREEIC